MYSKTIFVFVTDLFCWVKFPHAYLYVQKAAFTLDQTGKNLPNGSDWQYSFELQPGEIPSHSDDGDPGTQTNKTIVQGLNEKGWYVGTLLRKIHKSEPTNFHTSFQRSEVSLPTQAARELLSDLLREPKAR